MDHSTLLRGGLVIDATGEREADVVMSDDGSISAVGIDLSADTTLDVSGCIVAPGLVDIGTHLCEPGAEEIETIATGTRAAALGGYTAVLAMPDTDPAIDHSAIVREIQELAVGASCTVEIAGAITVGRAGERLAPMGEMAALGVRVFTDGGRSVADARLMRRALQYASSLGVTIAVRCEDRSLATGGHMHEGEWSARLGVAGICAEAEELIVQRDVALARLTGAPVHIMRVSTRRSIESIRRAKAEGIAVTCDVTPHHLTLTHDALVHYNPQLKVSPPLRPADDVTACVEGLGDGTIDAIATDHHPRSADAKELPFDEAPVGMLGLQTALSLALEAGLPASRAIAQLSWLPAAAVGLSETHGRTVDVGEPANLCVIDAEATWTLDAHRLASRAKNTPFLGRTFTGQVRHTFHHGTPTVLDCEAQR